MYLVKDEYDSAIFGNYIEAKIYAENRSYKFGLNCKFYEIDEVTKEEFYLGTFCLGKILD